jgi:hypothetical protein
MMKSIHLASMSVVVFAALLSAVCFGGTYSGGYGTETNPFRIADVNDLLELGERSEDYGAHFVLVDDIDLAGYVFTTAVIAPDTDMAAGYQGVKFSGVFDGKNPDTGVVHTLYNLTISNTAGQWYLGLFGYLDGGTIQNLCLENVSITTGAASNYTGGLTGWQENGLIRGCIVSGTLNGSNRYLGGITGYQNSGTISRCGAMCRIKGSSNCSYLGGLTGHQNEGIISDCYAIGSITGVDNSLYLGGLAGYQTGTLSNSYFAGSVNGKNYLGGLAGYQGNRVTTRIEKCYALVHLIGTSNIGGVVGYKSGTNGVLADCFWDSDYSMRTDGVGNINPDPAGVYGLTTSEMKTVSTYTAAGWDFASVWVIEDPVEYPRLAWQQEAVLGPRYSGGRGTKAQPYQLTIPADFVNLSTRSSDWDKSFVLTDNVDLSSLALTRALIAPDTEPTASGFDGSLFMGTFDGKGCAISNLTIAGSGNDYVGLIGCVGPAGQVRNLKMTGAVVQGRSCVGILAGGNKSLIHSCHVGGTVSGSSQVGGLAGVSDIGGILLNCSASCSVSGISDYVGGLVGYKKGPESRIENCQADCAVSGSGNFMGGLVGANISGRICDSFSAGTIASPGGDRLGGLAGSSNGIIERCGSLCSISCSTSSGSYHCGGLVGQAALGEILSSYAGGEVVLGNYIAYGCGGLIGTLDSGTVSNCCSTGRVRGIYEVGGFIGKQNGGDVSNAFSSGRVDGPYACRRGFIGYKSGGTVSRCFWDKISSNLYIGISGDSSADVTGKTTAEMKTLSTFTLAGWDFCNETDNGTNEIWRMCVEGTNYPKLNWQSGTGDFACADGVGVEDLTYLADRWLTSDCGGSGHCGGTDLNASGTVDLADFAVFAGRDVYHGCYRAGYGQYGMERFPGNIIYRCF